ncbi:FAD-dependent monooxygenase [Bradyrhizobium tropiciagri]|uniref:FAD-dependent oxidoreductase n=1 Tax=Bradyrhizobium tropiciagri TaxID=312253 RepID=UPI001BA78B50|nr:NAD(P)/FAD-dependent oxidoreductase [Bradyrhizobium tropiciagri]MBR0897477.1 FAD-dependent monooxygenase [Bradyrhizobium tropiciagri]
MSSSPIRIAIVGAGPGGLTLARLLHVAGIKTRLFEREASANARPQGGTLDLHAESGQLALARAGLTDGFLRIARYEDQGSRLYDGDGQLLLADDDMTGDRPEVDRTALRDLLLQSLPPDAVAWGHGLREVSPRDDGRYDLIFDDGREGPFDLVIGADGAWSQVRPLVSRYQPQYSGLTFIEFGIDDVDANHPALSQLVGRGKMGAESAGRSLIVQRNDNAHLRGYAIFRVPVEWAERRFDVTSPAAMRRALLGEFAGWADTLLDLFRASNDQFALRPIHALPVGHYWTNRPGITLLGDAAHLMSPFGGEGVNAAMLDAAELAGYLVGSADWQEAVRAYETGMFVRVAEPAGEAAEAAATELSHISQELTLAHHQLHMQMRAAAGHAAAR